MMPVKLDLHVHSESRGRVHISPKELKDCLRQKNMDGVAVTNFSNISHALWLKKNLSDYIIIVGQEMHTTAGHIVGLGIKERIDDFLSPAETIGRIHEQAGIAVAVHPYLPLGLGKKVVSLPLDAIEVYNAAMGILFPYNYLAGITARRLNIAQLSSTDTTNAMFVGHSYTEVMADSPASVLETIRLGRVRLFKRPMPFPFMFILKSFLNLRDIEPCSIHAMPCFVCGKSMTIRLFRKGFICLDCGRRELSRIACCNGHYFCIDCIIKRNAQANNTS
jgi:predicted metal-dependent phosphoesterase TrpH